MSEKRNKVNPMAWVFLAIVLGIASALIWGEKMSYFKLGAEKMVPHVKDLLPNRRT